MKVLNTPKKTLLTFENRIKAAKDRVENAFTLFTKASEELSHANLELSSIVQEAQAEIERHQKIVESAMTEINLNNKTKAFLDQFIPNKNGDGEEIKQ